MQLSTLLCVEQYTHIPQCVTAPVLLVAGNPVASCTIGCLAFLSSEHSPAPADTFRYYLFDYLS